MARENGNPAAAHYAPQTVPASSGPTTVSTTTLVILLVLSSVLSSVLGPLVQTGIKRTAELYLNIPPDAADHLRYGSHFQPPVQQQQQQQQPEVSQPPVVPSPVAVKPRAVPIAKRSVESFAESSIPGCKHGYQIFVINRDPFIAFIEDFLQPGEAEHMIELAKPRMARSKVVGADEHTDQRTSSSAYMKRSMDDVVHCIEERASRFTNISIEATEPLQVVWYTEGQEFRPHHDYLVRKDLKEDYWSRWGQRYNTFLVYLNEPEDGGGTIFSTLNFELAPKKNAALFWYNVDHKEKEDIRTMHGGSPVKGGEKYAINIWQRKMLPDLAPFVRELTPNEVQPPKEAPKYG